ncbi:MAG: hypothetical protein M0Q53_07370 [Prolixibacteraceae bacterium]|jgi:hypothetical protein|nr:hypothetical protein [Prolixibacteraceae bacterium]
MKTQFFEQVTNLDELRKEFYRLAFIHHPDRGGDLKTMQYLNDEYERLSFQLINSNEDFDQSRKEWEMELSEAIQEKLNKIISLPEITIELIGNWLWILGNTFPIRNILKQEGFYFSHPKAAWYFHQGTYIKKSGVIMSMDEMRNLWGQQKIQSEPQEQLN